ncbi:MAG: hypothetical protein N3B10_13035 [Armatimonadetes bacterium]|nr:hypothetical protein [Armatimonadota bacterium]
MSTPKIESLPEISEETKQEWFWQSSFCWEIHTEAGGKSASYSKQVFIR